MPGSASDRTDRSPPCSSAPPPTSPTSTSSWPAWSPRSGTSRRSRRSRSAPDNWPSRCEASCTPICCSSGRPTAATGPSSGTSSRSTASPVRDRSDRLTRLFLEGSPSAQEQIGKILDESSRFNIGDITRNINTPVFALQILEQANQRRFKFKRTSDRVPATVTQGRGRGRRLPGRKPRSGRSSSRRQQSGTLIKTERLRDLPSRGRFWIDPLTGRVLMSELIAKNRQHRGYQWTSAISPSRWSASSCRSRCVRITRIGTASRIEGVADVRAVPAVSGQRRRKISDQKVGAYGCATDVEGISQDQPGQHSDQGVSGDRRRRDPELQPAARRVSDAHPAEALVPEMRARSAEHRHRQGLRVREGALRHRRRGGHREGARRLDARHQPREVHRRHGDRSDLPRAPVLPRAGRPGGARGVRGDPRRDEGQGRHRQGRALRPRIPGEGAAARAGPGHVHAAARQRNPQHGSDRGAQRHAGDGQAGGSEARQAGDGHLRRRRRSAGVSRRLPGRACARSSTPRSKGARSWRRKSKRRRRWST